MATQLKKTCRHREEKLLTSPLFQVTQNKCKKSQVATTWNEINTAEISLSFHYQIKPMQFAAAYSICSSPTGSRIHCFAPIHFSIIYRQKIGKIVSNTYFKPACRRQVSDESVLSNDAKLTDAGVRV